MERWQQDDDRPHWHAMPVEDVLAKLAEMIVACGVDQEREAKGGAAMG